MMQRRLLCTVVVVLLTILGAAPSLSAQPLFGQDAEGAFARGQFEYAYAAWKKVLERRPGDRSAREGMLKLEEIAKGLFEQGLMLIETSPQKAREDLMTVVLITDPWSELNRSAREFLEEGLECSVGCVSARRAVEYRPLPELLREAASIRNFGIRKGALERIAATHPESPVPQYLIGQAREANGDRAGAMEAYLQAIEIRETCAPCHEALGQVLIQMGRTAEGETHLRMAKAINQCD